MQQHPDEEEWGNTIANRGIFDLNCPNGRLIDRFPHHEFFANGEDTLVGDG